MLFETKLGTFWIINGMIKLLINHIIYFINIKLHVFFTFYVLVLSASSLDVLSFYSELEFDCDFNVLTSFNMSSILLDIFLTMANVILFEELLLSNSDVCSV